MNREIKFRTWDKRVMKYSFAHSEVECDDHGVLCGPEHLMQYTGLKDKNGKEIYGNDVVTFQYAHEEQQSNDWVMCTSIAVIQWSEYNLGFKLYDTGESGRSFDIDTQGFGRGEVDVNTIRIIGNVYENPKLLT